ncbi:COG4315 family predicted lipoprotein [Monashia sp. NPDC004114]
MRTQRRTTRAALICVGLLGLLLGGCGAKASNSPSGAGSSTSESMNHPSTPAAGETLMSHDSSTSSSSSSSAPMMHGTQIAGGESQFGTVLFDGTGQAIYTFDVEKTSTPACYDACAAAWPPVLTEGAPAAGAGVQAGLLGTTTRTDGKTQVTYAGHPLYFYAHEGKHEVKCHNVEMNGGRWYAVQLDGMHAAT